MLEHIVNSKEEEKHPKKLHGFTIIIKCVILYHTF